MHEKNFPRKGKCLNEQDTHIFFAAKQCRKDQGKRGRGKEIPSDTAVNEVISQEEQQPGHRGNGTI